MQNMFYVYKIIQESLRFWIPCCGFQLKDSGFLVSVTWILDSVSSIPDSKDHDFRLHKKKNPQILDSMGKNFLDSEIWITFHRANDTRDP